MKIGPKYKICRRLGDNALDKCQTAKYQIAKSRKTKHTRRPKPKTEYGQQLIEKQKARFSYYVNEKQISNYVKKARGQRQKPPIEMLYELFEMRLDNVVYRAGIVQTRMFARQIVAHGHMTVNGIRVNIPSYKVRVGDVISVREGSKKSVIFSEMDSMLDDYSQPTWLVYDKKARSWTITAIPSYNNRPDLSLDFATIIEFYSRV